MSTKTLTAAQELALQLGVTERRAYQIIAEGKVKPTTGSGNNAYAALPPEEKVKNTIHEKLPLLLAHAIVNARYMQTEVGDKVERHLQEMSSHLSSICLLLGVYTLEELGGPEELAPLPPIKPKKSSELPEDFDGCH